MESVHKHRILVVALQGDSLIHDEIEVLRQGFERVDFFEIPVSEISGGVKSLLRSAFSLQGSTHRLSEKIRQKLSAETDVIVAYGDGTVAAAAVCAARVADIPAIIRLGRSQLHFEKAFSEASAVLTGSQAALIRLKALARGAAFNGFSIYNVTPAPDATANSHTAASHSLTFASEGSPQECFQLVKAMAVARPGSQIRWICLDSGIPEIKEELPVNFAVASASDLYEAISREPVDWLIMPEESPTFIPRVVLQALAAGVPVIAVDSPFMEEAVSDDCGILFGSDPQTEEFVKGLFPYVESDFRMNALRNAARDRWAELFSPETAGSRLVETICLCLNRK